MINLNYNDRFLYELLLDEKIIKLYFRGFIMSLCY